MSEGETLGERLRCIRIARKMTLAQLAEELGVSRPTIWSWESGRTVPRKNNLQALLETMNASENELILDSKETDQHDAKPPLEQQVAACRLHIARAAGVEPDAVEIIVRL
jgi:transcriptional regulator with XRE-family HTH domain